MARDISRSGLIGAPVPTTVLTLGTNAGFNTWVVGNDVTREQWLDNGVLVSQNAVPTTTQTRIADPSATGLGMMTLGDGVSGTNSSGIMASNKGKAIDAPAPLRRVRRDKCIRVLNMPTLLRLYLSIAPQARPLL